MNAARTAPNALPTVAQVRAYRGCAPPTSDNNVVFIVFDRRTDLVYLLLMPATNTAAILPWILTRCTVQMETTSGLYWSAVSAGISTMRAEGGMTISHDEIEQACYAAALRGELKMIQCGQRDMFRAVAA